VDITKVRQEGLGDGFSVLNPHDGFRQDNRLWFGTCSKCGEMVTNSTLHGYWEHTIYTRKEYWSQKGYESGICNSSTSHNVAYCPTARGETHQTEVVLKF
jgi:hypothetical protein